jgi:hypothetical protein
VVGHSRDIALHQNQTCLIKDPKNQSPITPTCCTPCIMVVLLHSCHTLTKFLDAPPQHAVVVTHPQQHDVFSLPGVSKSCSQAQCDLCNRSFLSSMVHQPSAWNSAHRAACFGLVSGMLSMEEHVHPQWCCHSQSIHCIHLPKLQRTW